jgi:peroxiredoxin
MEDRSFTGGVRPGDPMPDFVLPTTTGRRVRKTDFVGKQPVLLAFGSFT